MEEDSKKRTLAKTLIWRIIGVIWTWLGAYIIISLIAESSQKASETATAVTIFHHSTRMIMYYFYERFWNKISWGKKRSIAWNEQ